MFMRITAILLVLGFAVAPDATAQQWGPELEKALEAARNAPRPTAAHVEDLWRLCHRDFGRIQPLLERLTEGLGDGDTPDARRCRRLLGSLLCRDGRLLDGYEVLSAIPEADRSADLRFELAEILDMRGQVEAAKAAYQALLDEGLLEDRKDRILLRLALMDPAGSHEALVAYARSEGLDRARRNAAAVILGLFGREKDAVELFEVEGEKTKRFRQLVRLTEWALSSKQFDKAREFAWGAAESAVTRRDKRYGLSLVASAYRIDGKIDDLLQKFESTSDLGKEARKVWIDLLREEGRAKDALRLFSGGKRDEWTPLMRRRLLEICRETGDEGLLVASFRSLIEQEPRNLEWRSGLSRYYLEQGKAKEARQVWADFDPARVSASRLMEAARWLADIGLNDVARGFARAAAGSPKTRETALLFLARLDEGAGRPDGAIAALKEILETARPKAGVRAEVAGEFERMGRVDLAVQTFEALRAAHGGNLGTDLEMKYALLLSKVEREEDAMRVWRGLWERLRGTPRGRYVEERLMTVASRIGALAKIAIELEDRLEAGSADTKDVDLLVRLYIKVQDPASATEIIEEYLNGTGGSDLEILKRKAQIYAACNDFYHYEEVVRRLIELDEENRLDHLRELVMSQLDRGRRDQAIALLPEIRKVGGEGEAIADEFEAGVYGLAGLKEKAIESYMRGLGRHPERIDTLLLVSNLMRETGREMDAVHRFQYLALHAPKDDLFTVAIDGILNLRAPRNSRVPDSVVRWALRVTLERLARKPDRFYLYRLASDLAVEVKDMRFAIRDLKAAIPVASDRRTSLLREIMGKARTLDPASRQVFGGDGGMQVSPTWDATDYLMVGRRLLGQGEYVPPQVFMDMAAVFLAKGKVADAMRTFSRASELLDRSEVTHQAARVLEKAGRYGEALTFYRRLLATDAESTPLMVKVGELEELSGREEEALAVYRRGFDLALDKLPRRVVRGRTESPPEDPWGTGVQRNVDANEAATERLISGIMATLEGPEAVRDVAKALLGRIEAELGALREEGPGLSQRLADHPRLDLLARALRRTGLAFRALDVVDEADTLLARAFPGDRKLLRDAIRSRARRGLVGSAARLLRSAAREDDPELATLAGIASLEGRRLSPGAVAQEIVPRIHRPEGLRALLERADMALGGENSYGVLPLLVSAGIVLDSPETAEAAVRAAVRWSSGKGYPALDRGLKLVGLSNRISPRLSQDLLGTLIDGVLSKEPQLATSLSYRLEAFSSVKLSPATVRRIVKRLIETSVQGRVLYGLGGWVKLLPQEEQAAFVREVHGLLDGESRMRFLVDSVRLLREPLDDSFIDWFAGALKKSIEAVASNGQPNVFFSFSGPSSSRRLRLAVLEVTKGLGRGGEQQFMRWLALLEADRGDEVLKDLKADLSVLTQAIRSEGIEQYYANQLLGRLTMKAWRTKFLDIVARAVEDSPKDRGLREFYVNQLARIGGEAYEAYLQEGLRKNENDTNLLQRLEGLKRKRGNLVEAAKLLERLVALKPDDKRSRTRLASTYLALRRPLDAKAAREAVDEEKKKPESSQEASPSSTVIVPGGVVISTSSIVASSGAVILMGPGGGAQGKGAYEEIKARLAKGERNAARAALRKLWRRLGDTSRYPRPLSFVLRWNPPRKPGAAKSTEGGKKPPRTLFGALAEDADFVPDEARKLLLFLEEEQTSTPEWFRSELIELILPRDSEKRVDLLEKLEREIRDGSAGDLAVDEVFMLLEDSGVSDADRKRVIRELVSRPSVPGARRLRGLARGFAADDQLEVARRLYRLTAVLASLTENGGYLSTVQSWRELLGEVEKVLGDTLGPKTVLAMVEDLKPSDYRVGSWMRIALDTWERLLDAKEARRKALALLDELSDAESTRWAVDNARSQVARMCLATGDATGALRLLATWLREGAAAEAGNLGLSVNAGTVRRVLNQTLRDREKAPSPSTLAAFYQGLREWHDEGRLLEPRAVFGVLASYWARAKERDERAARDLADLTISLGAEDRELTKAGIALDRALGRHHRAYVAESRLMMRHLLPVKDYPRHLKEALEQDGTEVAFLLGLAMASETHHPEVLKEVIALAHTLDHPEVAARFATLRERVLAQEAADKARAEAEKKAAAATSGERSEHE